MYRHLLVALLIVPTFAVAAPPPVTPDNPQPLEGDFILPMPGGREMVFRPVFLEVGDSLSAKRKFKLGDRSGQRDELREVSLSGSFIAPSKAPHPRDALFFMGKYEITAGQFAAMPRDGEKPPAEPQLPQVQLTRTEIESFIEKYNSWLNAQAGDRLPKADGVPGFLRLPTEEEWEFAARGGRAVSAENFEATTPYNGPLGAYEWFAGPSSSQGKLRKAGLLRPGPLGICDMLGNASEMALLPFTLLATGTKMGGHTVRGGSVQSELSEVRASLRFELPPYDAKGLPMRGDVIGFRLLVTTMAIITDKNADTIKGRQQPMEPKPPESPQTAEHLAQLLKEARAALAADNPQQALVKLGEAAQLAPNDAEILAQTAFACEKLGYTDKARAAWEQVLKFGKGAGIFAELARTHLQPPRPPDPPKSEPTTPKPDVAQQSAANEDRVRAFVGQRIATENTRNLDDIMRDYAENVRYWELGGVTRKAVRAAKEKYFSRWEETGEQLEGPIEIARGSEPNTYRASFTTRYRVHSTARREAVQGRQRGAYTVLESGGRFLVTAESGEVLDRQRIADGPDAPAQVAGSTADPEHRPETLALPGERYPLTRQRMLQDADVAQMNADQMRYAINEIYARRGKYFSSTPDITRQFSRMSWYQPDKKADDAVIEARFTPVEKYNVDFLAAWRAQRRSGVAPSRSSVAVRSAPQQHPIAQVSPKPRSTSTGYNNSPGPNLIEDVVSLPFQILDAILTGAASSPPQQRSNRLPFAQRTQKPGLVLSPYLPLGAVIDVRGIPRGAKVVDPRNDLIFINP